MPLLRDEELRELYADAEWYNLYFDYEVEQEMQEALQEERFIYPTAKEVAEKWFDMK